VAADLKSAMGSAADAKTILDTPDKKTASRSTWKGYISAFGVMLIPAATLKATDVDAIETHMYHSAACPNRLVQKYTCSCCDTEVPNARTNALKGVEVGDKVITLTQAELDAQKPTSDKILKVTEFVPADAIDVTYYESSEYIAADKGGEKAFATFQQALAQTGRIAIGTFVSRGHQYTVALRPKGQYGIVMSYLFAEYEVRNCGKWTPVVVNPAEVDLVKQLMTETELAKEVFTPAAYDPYLSGVRKMIAAKANGTEVCTPAADEVPKATDDLLAALKATLEQQKAKAAKAGV
jgi:DNA end-binding protein Ku